MKTILVTGVAGFIGHKTSEKLLAKGYHVVGIDNLNDYYDINLKKYRLKALLKKDHFTFLKIDIEDKAKLRKIFTRNNFSAVINLAARAGVPYSMVDPGIYFTTNINGTLNLLEMCRHHKIFKFILASTSSIYAGSSMPFKETLPVNTPISPYAASKKAAETVCYTYHHLFGIDVSIVRYFTVYGPAGRPDMSPFRFIKWIDEGIPIKIFGDGMQRRDFSYVDDIAEGTIAALKRIGYEIFNLGGNRVYCLMDMIHLMERYLGKRAKFKYLPFHKTDVRATSANISKAQTILKWNPKVSFPEGVAKTVEWHNANRDFVSRIKL